MSQRTPVVGEPVYIDGFRYDLVRSKRYLGEDESTVVVLWEWERPAAPDAATAERHRRSVNYKLSMKGAQADLLWVTRAGYLDLARAQADALLRGGTTQAARLWGQAAYQAISEAIGTWPEAFWTMAGRQLVDPPCRFDPAAADPRAPVMVVPATAAEALTLARAALDHSFYALAEG